MRAASSYFSLDEAGAHPTSQIWRRKIFLGDGENLMSHSLAAFFFSAALIAPDIAAASGGGGIPSSVPAETRQAAPANQKAHTKKSKTTTHKSGAAEDFLRVTA